MTLSRLFLLFVLVPLADLTLLVWVAGRLGFWPTVATVVLTAAVGSWLARREGSAAWKRVSGKMAAGGVPGPELIDGLIILISGILLLTPGFLTDITGLLGLLPPTRAAMRKALASGFQSAVKNGSVRVASGGFGGMAGGPMGGMAGGFGTPSAPQQRPVEDAEIIDAEIVEEHSRPLRSDRAPEA